MKMMMLKNKKLDENTFRIDNCLVVVDLAITSLKEKF